MIVNRLFFPSYETPVSRYSHGYKLGDVVKILNDSNVLHNKKGLHGEISWVCADSIGVGFPNDRGHVSHSRIFNINDITKHEII